MKSIVKVIQKDLNTNKENILCDQLCEIEESHNKLEFVYDEKKPFNGKVHIMADLDECVIERRAESSSYLKFQNQKKTVGKVMSSYGTFHVDLMTHHYFFKGNLIAIEYDVMNGHEVMESYRMMIKIKRVNEGL